MFLFVCFFVCLFVCLLACLFVRSFVRLLFLCYCVVCLLVRMWLCVVFAFLSRWHYSTSPPGVNQVDGLPPAPNNIDPVVNRSDRGPRRSMRNHSLNLILTVSVHTVTSSKIMRTHYIILYEDPESMKKNEQ